MQRLSLPTREETLEFNFGIRWAIAFVALFFVHNEFHEIAHTAVGRLICGAWGSRNFNSWETACYSEPEIVLAPIAGLVWSYGLMWIGYYFLSPQESPARQSLGFCLIFAAVPFGRLLTVAMGGGDESVILESIFPTINSSLLLVVGVASVLVLIGPPLYRTSAVLSQQRKRLVLGGLFVLPLVLFLIVILGVANPLLAQGVLAQQGLLGSPLIVNVWTAFWLLVLAASWQRLSTTLVAGSGGVTGSQ